MVDNNTVTKEMNDTETQFLLLTMSHIEYKIGKIHRIITHSVDCKPPACRKYGVNKIWRDVDILL